MAFPRTKRHVQHVINLFGLDKGRPVNIIGTPSPVEMKAETRTENHAMRRHGCNWQIQKHKQNPRRNVSPGVQAGQIWPKPSKVKRPLPRADRAVRETAGYGWQYEIDHQNIGEEWQDWHDKQSDDRLQGRASMHRMGNVRERKPENNENGRGYDI